MFWHAGWDRRHATDFARGHLLPSKQAAAVPGRRAGIRCLSMASTRAWPIPYANEQDWALNDAIFPTGKYDILTSFS
jgi:hypothetical protein